MPTKTISLRIEAYDRLKAAKRFAGESYSEVVLRASWPEYTTTAADFLSLCRERGPVFSKEGLEKIERLKTADRPPDDKWATR